MSRFDEEPDGDIHGECAAEIHRLEAKIAAETKNKAQFERDWLECTDKLLACQARERVLLDALYYLANNLGEYAIAMPSQQQADTLMNFANAAFEALAQPSDDSAIKQLLAQERTEIAAAIPVMREYARENPRFNALSGVQDPNGVHAWLVRNDNVTPNAICTPSGVQHLP